MAALEATALARTLRASVWAYPLVNAGHVAGIALLVGSIIPLDLRLLGAWRATPLAPLWMVLSRTAAAGLVMAIGFGLLLFTTRATEYIASNFFVAKMAIVALAIVNAITLHLMSRVELANTSVTNIMLPTTVRVSAGVSLVSWLSALTLGRLVGYF